MGQTGFGGASRSLLLGGGALFSAAALAAGMLLPPAAQAAEVPQPAKSATKPVSWTTTNAAQVAAQDDTADCATAMNCPAPADSAAATTTPSTTEVEDELLMHAARPTGCARSLTVVAHQDDDLLFINPQVSNDIAAGRCVVTIFLTAGDAGRPTRYWRNREKGAMAAYAAMAGSDAAWVTDHVRLAGHRIARASLPGTGVALLFLRLPDGHGNEARPGESLQGVWRRLVGGIGPLDDDSTYYTREDLIDTLTAAMDDLHPDSIHTLDFHGQYGDGDHADHHTAGYLTYEAQRAYRATHQLTGYLGYPVEHTPENLDPAARDQKLAFFLAYAPFDPKVCQTADACLTNFYAPRFTHTVPATAPPPTP